MDKVKQELRKYNTYLKALEERIIDLMEEINITRVKFKDEETNEIKEIVIDTKIKKETLTRKKIKQNCLSYCNGNSEQTDTLIDYLYDKDARGFKETEKIKIKKIKDKKK